MSHCPLPSFIELPADRILWGDCECVAKGTVRKPDRQVGIEHQQAFTDRLYEIPVGRLRSRPGPAHLLMTGLILDSRNTILLERAPPPPALRLAPKMACTPLQPSLPIVAISMMLPSA